MNPLQLDHIGFIVEDLDAARDLFQGLGFTLTPRADHTRAQTLPTGVTLGLPDPEALADRARRLGLAVRPAGDGGIEIDLSAPCGLQLLAAREPRPGTVLHNATHEP